MSVKFRNKATLFRSHHNEGGKCAWVISYTPVANEPRVLRQTQALSEAGWRIVVAGYQGHSPISPEWNFILIKQNRNPYIRYFLAFRYIAGLLICKYANRDVFKKFGIRLYTLGLPNWRDHYNHIIKIAGESPDLRADLVISHDYFTTMLGYDLAKLFNAKFVIDTHEYAREQYMHDQKWITRHRPYVVATQDYYFARAEVVTTVCDGIARILDAEQKLKQPVVIVRSVPFKNIQSFREVNNRIKVLYHGNINFARGIHLAIKSMPMWRQDFDFIIRGSGDKEYIEYLQTLARELNVYHRVIIEKSVPFNEIIPTANLADIGYFVHENISRQKLYTLPNKFFEYVMAGLALCVSNLPEMARLVSKYNLGKLVDSISPSDIADTINSFNKNNIESYKRASMKAAAELNWDVEKQVMLNAYNGIL